MKKAAAKVSIVAILSLALGCGIAAVAGCTKGQGTTYSTVYTAKADYFAAELPIRPMTEEEYEDLGIRKVTLDLTIQDSGSYTLVAKDMGETDSQSEKAWHRTYTVKGTYTNDSADVYVLSEAVSVKCKVFVGRKYEDTYGRSGTTSSKDSPELLSVFTACTVTVAEGQAIYTLPAGDTDPVPAPDQALGTGTAGGADEEQDKVSGTEE